MNFVFGLGALAVLIAFLSFVTSVWERGADDKALARVLNAGSAIATILLALATAYLAFMGHRRLNVLEADQRPWLFLYADPLMASQFAMPQPHLGAYVWFHFPVKNAGRSPAIKAAIIARIFDQNAGHDVQADQRRVCEAARTAPVATRVFEYHLFPNEEITLPDLVHWEEEPAHSNIVMPSLVCCITYFQYAVQEEEHQTAFIYDIVRLDGAQILRDGGPIQPSQLRVRINPVLVNGLAD